MKRQKITILLMLIMLLNNIGFAMGREPNEEKRGGMSMQPSERYKNISTAPSYILAKVRDSETEEIFNIVLRNDDLASYFAEKRGLSVEAYVAYMIKNEDNILDINMVEFEKFVGKRHFGNERNGKKFIRDMIFDKPMTLNQLEVEDESKLIESYFDFDYAKGYGMLKSEYYEKYTSNPAFIALLIKLGYNAFQGDIVPNLNIYKK